MYADSVVAVVGQAGLTSLKVRVRTMYRATPQHVQTDEQGVTGRSRTRLVHMPCVQMAVTIPFNVVLGAGGVQDEFGGV